MRGWRGTVVLLVVAGGLVVALQWTGDESAPVTLDESALDDRDLLSATRIVLRNGPGLQPIQLARATGYGFDVVEPLRDMAGEAKLQSMASAWDTARLIRVYEAADLDEDLLQQLGLDDPRAEVEIEFGAHTVRLELGAEGPFGTEIWVRKNGAVYQGSVALFSSIAGTPDDFREALVFRNRVSGLQSLEIVRKANGNEDVLALHRVGTGIYELTQPLRARAGRQIVESFCASVTGLVASRFLGGSMTPRPNPDYEIVVRGALGDERVRLWRELDGTLVGVQSPRELAFAIDAGDFVRALEVPANQLRSRLLVRTAIDDIQQITLDPGAGRGQPVVLRRGRDQLFEMVEPLRVPADASAVGRLLDGLRGLAVVDFVDDVEDLGAFGLGQGGATLAVVGQLSPETETVQIGRVDGERCYFRREGDAYAAIGPVACRDAFTQAWTEFVGRRPFRIDAIDNVRQLVFSRGEIERRFVRGDDGKWRADGEETPREDVFDAVAELCDVRAEEVLDPTQVGDAGMTGLEMRSGNGMVLARLSIQALEERVLVRLNGTDAVFQLGRLASRAILPLLP